MKRRKIAKWSPTWRVTVIKTVIVLGLVAASITSVVGAVLADPQGPDSDTFTIGSLELAVSPASAAIAFSGMAPGDRVTAPVTVSNEGTLRYRYSVTSTATNDDAKGSAGRLALTIKTGVTVCSGGGFATDGTLLYGPADLGSVPGINVMGDPAEGAQIGDRTLDPTKSEVLCMRVALPRDTGDAFQGASTTATFTFHAERVEP